MSRKIRMMLYGTSGVGKSVFAFQFPKPFFITTDNNYSELVPFGAKMEDHRQIFNFTDFEKIVADDKLLDKYETIVVDLVEDVMSFAENTFVEKHKLEHIGDVGHGKGYAITRNDFFVEISKLIAKNKHIILLSHEDAYTVKDRRGVENWVYKPSGTIPDKVLDKLIGRLRFTIRAYFEDEVKEDGTIVQKRMLSLVPKTGEQGVIRGVNTETIPNDIPLSPSLFFETITEHEPDLSFIKHVEERKPNRVDPVKAGEIIKEEETKIDNIKDKLKKANKPIETKEEPIAEEIIITNDASVVPEVKVEVKETVVEPEPVKSVEPEAPVKADPRTMIKAKLTAVKAGVAKEKLDKVVELMISSNDITEENAAKIAATIN